MDRRFSIRDELPGPAITCAILIGFIFVAFAAILLWLWLI